MPYYHHHHHGYYGRRSNPICSAIALTVFIIVYFTIMREEIGYSGFGYYAPLFVLVIVIAAGGIVASIVTAAKRKSQMQTQPEGVRWNPQGYPPQGTYPPQVYPPAGAAAPQGYTPQSTYPPQGYPPAGVVPPQQSTYNPATFQGVPQPRPVGIQQPQPAAQAPASPPRFCASCGMPVGSADQRFCANCGAGL